jgi:hypothetical protein
MPAVYFFFGAEIDILSLCHEGVEGGIGRGSGRHGEDAETSV